jgi:hypothetical protein
MVDGLAVRSSSNVRGRAMQKTPEGVGLDEALEALRAELASARLKAAGQDLQFPVQSLTIELKVGVTRSKEGKAGFHVPLIEAQLGGSAGVDRETLQTVTLVLGPPVDQHGVPVKVASVSTTRKG